MTLSPDLEEWHKEQAGEAQRHSKPKERSIGLVWILRVVSSRCRVVGNTCKNCCADAETDRSCQLDGCLEKRAGYGLLRLRQSGHDVHLGRIKLAKGQE